MTIIFQIARRYFAAFTYFFSTFKQRFVEFLQIKFIKTHEKFSVINMSNLKGAERIAIVAVFPTRESTPSTMRLIKYLKKNGFEILLVVNQNSNLTDRYLSDFKSLDLSILLRPNLGRDFGAYQAGFKFLAQNEDLISTRQLIFANDSVLYGPRSAEFIRHFLNFQSNWKSFFINYQYHMHAQSFFMNFSDEVFKSDSFVDFWLKYYPTGLRHRVINDGEVQLTQTLLNNGHTPQGFVSSTLKTWSKDIEKMNYDELFSLWNGFYFKEFVELKHFAKLNELQFHRTLMEANPTHHLGLFVSRTIGAPLKLDLLRTGLVSFSGLEITMESLGLSKEEITDLMKLYARGGSYVSSKGLIKLWRDYGYV